MRERVLMGIGAEPVSALQRVEGNQQGEISPSSDDRWEMLRRRGVDGSCMAIRG